MSAHIITIADALAESFNRDVAKFCMPFTAQRRFVPRYELPQIAETAVDVVPLGYEHSPASRLKTEMTTLFRVGIVLQKHLGTDEKCNADLLVELAQQFDDYIRTVRLSLTPDTNYVESSFPQLINPERIESANVFYTVLQTTWRAWR